MTVSIKVDQSDDVIINVQSEDPTEIDLGEKKKPQSSLDLIARKTMDGNVVILDHPDIDIVVMTNEKKVISFPTESNDDIVYETQNDLFKYLAKKGIIDRSTVKSGNIYGSLEAKLLEPIVEENSPDIIQTAVFTVGKYIEKERPNFKYQQELERLAHDQLSDPDEEHSTELGEVPHSEFKGSIRPGLVRRLGYGFYYMYESKEKRLK